MIRTESGRILLPVYDGIKQNNPNLPLWPYIHGGYNSHGVFVASGPHTYDPGQGYCFVLYSDDDGTTWQRSEGELLIRMPDYHCESIFEPSIVEYKPGKLLMILRARVGRYFQSWSEDDDGTTWSRPAPTQLSGAQHPAQIRKMPNGDLLVLWAQHSEQELLQGFMRTRLSTAVSKNGGITWEHFQNVDSIHEGSYFAPGPIRISFPVPTYPIFRRSPAPEFDASYAVPIIDGYGSRSYPSVVVADDRVLIFYSYQTKSDTGASVLKARLKIFPLSWFYGGLDPNNDDGLVPKIRKAQEKKEEQEEHSGKA